MMPEATRVVSVLHQMNIDYVESLSVSYDTLQNIVESDEVTVESIKNWRQLKFVVLPVMTMLSRSIKMRLVAMVLREQFFSTHKPPSASQTTVENRF